MLFSCLVHMHQVTFSMICCRLQHINRFFRGAVLREGGTAPQVRGLPPNEIFSECNWTSGMKIYRLYVGFIPKLHFYYMTKKFSRWPTPFAESCPTQLDILELPASLRILSLFVKHESMTKTICFCWL